MPGSGALARASVRVPDLRVLADGIALPGVISADVKSNGYAAADRFCVRFAAAAGGLVAVDVAGLRLDVQVGLGGGWTSLIVGEADRVGFDVVEGVVEVDGRDLSALMLDSRVDETFANRTSGEIVQVIAARHGLVVDIAAAGGVAGRYYQSDHERVALGQFGRSMTEWDLVAGLAQREGFSVSMVGETLRFGPIEDSGAAVLTPADCESLHMEHVMPMQRSIEVTVRSWAQQDGTAVSRTARGGGSGRAWTHHVTRPNLPAEEAQTLAERILADLVRQERRVEVRMPGELGISVRGRVLLQGTGTAWDRAYAVSEVNRRIDVRGGFMQTLVMLGVV